LRPQRFCPKVALGPLPIVLVEPPKLACPRCRGGKRMPRGRQKNDPASAPARQLTKTSNPNHANLGFEAQLFLAADKLSKNLEPSDYKHVCLVLGRAR